ncbi:MAG: nucleotidyltransferase family protein [Acidobacteriaceae bacterium]
MQNLSGREWRSLLHWLDISGLALYFLDRIVELKLTEWLPPSVLARLQENLADNTERTLGMIAESIAIQQKFQEARLSYANLKGLSLWQSSVPKPELRSQFDLDFLVAEESAPEARRILERRGYRLYVISGRSWEFKLNEKPGVSLKDLYKALPSHAVELHIESNAPGRSSALERTERRDLHGCTMPVLSPVDLFLGQGLHAYKHVCSEFSRVAHLLEFRRHVLFRRDDQTFWSELRSTAGGSPRACLGLGVVTLLITHVMGDFAPEALSDWTVECLPRSARLWVERYGRRAVFGSIPGSKLYLVLQRELEAAGVPAKRSLRQILLPVRMPPPVIRAFPNETLSVRLGRYRMQLHFILLRLRFHVVEGVRYVWESYRWRRQIDRFEP